MTDAYRRFLDAAKTDPELSRSLDAIKDDPEEIAARFQTELSFGTAGLRGIMGVGSCRMNLYTVSRATNGLFDHVAKRAKTPVFVIAYDTRLNSAEFARRTALVLSGRGARVYLASRPVPVPFLSFSIRVLHADAGVCITASHNPAQYNGYKAYGPDGCQLLDEDAHAVEAAMRGYDYFAPVGAENGVIEEIPERVFDAYFADLSAKALCPKPKEGHKPFSVVYSPLNGTGLEFVPRALKDLGFEQVYLVEEQARHDGNFPTCPRPNPELKEALTLAVKLAKEKRADLVIATDPDCDRVGVAVPDKNGDYRLLSGNETGVLLFDFLCQMKASRPAYACTTIVSTPLADEIAKAHNVELKHVLTGFKYIGTFIESLAAKGRGEEFLFGFEESYGYLLSDRVRDKDACEASARICEMARAYHEKGISLIDALEELSERYGFVETALINYEFSSAADAERAQTVLKRLRQEPIKTLCHRPVTRFCDYLAGTVTDLSGSFPTGLPQADVLSFETDDGVKLILRPSGTEPKCKLYLFVRGKSRAEAKALMAHLQDEASAIFSV